jgi:hypothetical protein
METGRAFYPVFDSLSRLVGDSIFGVRRFDFNFSHLLPRQKRKVSVIPRSGLSRGDPARIDAKGRQAEWQRCVSSREPADREIPERRRSGAQLPARVDGIRDSRMPLRGMNQRGTFSNVRGTCEEKRERNIRCFTRLARSA